MDHYHSTTGQHVKGKHLTFEERVIIQTRRKDGWSANRIAKELGCAPNTIRNELRRGTVNLYRGKVQRYKASQGQKTYEQNRTNCCRHYERLEKAAFLQYVDRHVREDEVTCTKTLYNYVDLGLMETNFIIFLVAFKALSIKLVSQGILTCSYNGSSSLHY